MEERYHPELVEPKWQTYWKENQLFKVIEDPGKEK
jgi:leucyl-tRNA synthetase